MGHLCEALRTEVHASIKAWHCLAKGTWKLNQKNMCKRKTEVNPLISVLSCCSICHLVNQAGLCDLCPLLKNGLHPCLRLQDYYATSCNEQDLGIGEVNSKIVAHDGGPCDLA